MRRTLVMAGACALVLAAGGPASARPPGGGGGGGKPSISHAVAAAVGVGENDAPSFQIAITRTGKLSRCETSVDYAFTDGTATYPGDFDASPGTAHFASGQTVAMVSLGLRNDGVPESDETFSMTLSNPVSSCRTPATLGNATQTVTVTDTDVVMLVPAGDRITVDTSFLGGCHPLGASLRLSTGSTLPIGALPGGCDFTVPGSMSWTNDTGVAVTAVLMLVDHTCERSYFSDTTSFDDELVLAGTSNHALVTPTGPRAWNVRMNDGQSPCDDGYSVPSSAAGNLVADVAIDTPTVGPPPATGLFTLAPGQSISWSMSISSCNGATGQLWTADGIQSSLPHVDPTCSTPSTWADFFDNETTDDLDVWFVLFDLYCLSGYASDGTGDADHATVSGSNPTQVDIADGGVDCAQQFSGVSPGTGEGSMTGTATLSGAP